MSGVKKTTRRTKNVSSWVEFWNKKINFIEGQKEETINKKDEDYKKANFVNTDSLQIIDSKILSSKVQEAKTKIKINTNLQFLEIIKNAEQIMNETKEILKLIAEMMNIHTILKMADVAFKVFALINEIYKVMTDIKKALIENKVSVNKKGKNINKDKINENDTYEENFKKFIVSNDLLKLNVPIERIGFIEKKKISCCSKPNLNLSNKSSNELRVLTTAFLINPKLMKFLRSKNETISIPTPKIQNNVYVKKKKSKY